MALNPITARWGHAHITSTDFRKLMYIHSGGWAHRAHISWPVGDEDFQVTVNSEDGSVLDISKGFLIYHGFIVSNDTAATITLEMPAATVYKKALLYIGINIRQNVESVEFGVEYSEAASNPDAVDYPWPEALYYLDEAQYDYTVIEQNDWRLGYSYIIPLARMILHGSTVESLEELIPIWGAKSFYAPRDEIDLSCMISPGYIAANSKNIYFFIPFRKDVVGVTGATISGAFTIRHADGSFIGESTGQTLESLGTVNVYVYDSGAYVRCILNNASALTNQSVLSVHAANGAKLTLS